MAKALKWKSRNECDDAINVTTGQAIGMMVDSSACRYESEMEQLQDKVKALVGMLQLVVNSLPADSQVEIASRLRIIEGRSNVEN